MAVAAVHTCTTAGHGNFPPTTSAGGDSLLTVDGKPVLLVGQTFIPHTDGKTTHTPTLVEGSDLLTINGIQIGLVGSALDCGDSIASSASNLLTIG